MDSKDKQYAVYHHIPGTVLLIGYGSIGKGFIPLLKRHLTYDRFVIIDPVNEPPKQICDQFIKVGLKKDNFTNILNQVFGGKGGFCVNLSVDTSSKDLVEYCQSRKIFYLDTATDEWVPYYDQKTHISDISNYGLRYYLAQNTKKNGFKTTAVSCCGANPGMVSWFVKKALMNIAKDINGEDEKIPESRQQWSLLMKKLKIKGIQIAERDTQRSSEVRPINHFWNTWSVDGFIFQGLNQPAQLGWGNHQKWRPSNAKDHDFGEKHAIYLNQPGMNAMVKSWCPTPGPQIAFLVTHNQSISITDYYTQKNGNEVVYRPTTFYAYHPCEQTVSSCIDVLATGVAPSPDKFKIINESIVDGKDELGVLIYGHDKNAYWYGSQLDIHRTRQLVDSQNATALQVTSAVLAGVVWALENPEKGLVEPDEMDYKRCLEVQREYIEPLNGFYTEWNPLQNQLTEFSQDSYDLSDPWQFKNMIIRK